MEIQEVKTTVYFVKDENGETISRPFFYMAEAQEWIEENKNDNTKRYESRVNT